jgi:hypothetical protein
MHRVLDPHGRLVLSTWQRLERHPFHQAVHETTLARLGISTVESVFSLGDPDQLRALVQDAGFHQVRLLQRSVTSHFPNGAELVEFELGFDAARAPALEKLDRVDQQQVVDEVRAELAEQLSPFVHDGVLVLPMHAHLVTAAP